jgi:glycosyltransferase involved in cell wall biosynthesis
MAERTRALNTGREADPLTVSCDQPRSASPDLRDRAGLPGGRCEALARPTRAGGKAGRRLLFIVNDTTFFASHRLPIAVAAREAGFEVALAALDTGRVDEIRAQGIAYHPLAVDRTGVNPLRDVRLFWQLSRLIRTVRPTLLHTVTIKPVIYGGIAARLYRVPSLVSAVSGLGLVFIDQGRKTLLVRRVVRALYRLALGHKNSCAIFQNPDDRQHMVDAGLVPGERTVLIRGSGVDVDAFRPSPPPPGPPLVIMPGRLLWQKGVGEFVEAARILRRQGVPLRMVLVGEPPAHNRASVPCAKIKTWVEQGLIEAWGHRSDMPQVYTDCHIVCLPSYYGEGVPLTLLEAAACGRPIVTTDMPGCREVVRDGDNGLLVPPRAAEALAEALRALAGDPARRLEMGRRGRERAVSEFALERVVAATLAVYERLSATPER